MRSLLTCSTPVIIVMQIDICPTRLEDKTTIWDLFQFYCHDISSEDQCDVESDGLFSLSADYFAQYWSRPGWAGHLLRVDNAIAGFALIEPSDAVDGAHELADLFVLKRFRRAGVAKRVALHFLACRSVPWTVTVVNEAEEARLFWHRMFCLPQLAVSRQVPDPDGRAVTVHVLEPNIPTGVDPRSAATAGAIA